MNQDSLTRIPDLLSECLIPSSLGLTRIVAQNNDWLLHQDIIYVAEEYELVIVEWADIRPTPRCSVQSICSNSTSFLKMR